MSRILTLAATAFLTLASALPAQTAPQAPPSPAAQQAPPPAAAAKGFTVPEVRRFTLPDGLEVRLIPYGTVPKVSVQLYTQTGNIDEGADQVWLADLVGELMQQGTTTRSAQDIALSVARMGGSLDVSVRSNQTVVRAEVLSDYGPQVVALIADVVRNPRMPESELARLKADQIRNLSIALSRQQQLAAQRFASALYPHQPYGRMYPTQAMIQTYALPQARAFYERNFGAARSRLYVAGLFDGAAMEQAIRSGFDGWSRGNPATQPNVTTSNKRGLFVIDRPAAVQSTIYIGLSVLDPSNPDYIPMVVTDALLGGSFGSRITSNIREQKGYTYSPFSSITTRLRAGYWAEIADVTTNVTGPSLKEIVGEIDRLRGEPPTMDELKGIQNYMAGIFLLRNSSRGGIIGQLAFSELYGLGEDFLRNYVQRIYNVTPSDVQRVTEKYLDPSKMTIVVAGDRKAIADQLKPYGDILE
jgi:zinc protease